jgi:hypothetical protein
MAFLSWGGGRAAASWRPVRAGPGSILNPRIVEGRHLVDAVGQHALGDSTATRSQMV